MSATNRGAIRREADLYPTPKEPVYALLNETLIPNDVTLGEPCCGDNDIISAVHDRVFAPYVWEWAEISKGRDYLKDGLTGPVDGIITNPPFSLAQEFIDRSLNEAGFVAYLLRLNFLGSQDRKKWWRNKQPTHLFVLSERPAFVSICKGGRHNGVKIKSCGQTYPLGTTGKCECGGSISKGTDATEYAWFVWDRSDWCDKPPGIYVI